MLKCSGAVNSLFSFIKQFEFRICCIEIIERLLKLNRSVDLNKGINGSNETEMHSAIFCI